MRRNRSNDCTTITSVDLAHYGVSRAKDGVSVDCGTNDDNMTSQKECIVTPGDPWGVKQRGPLEYRSKRKPPIEPQTTKLQTGLGTANN